MFGGALLALFSVNFKRTLACSSMSQIGFILIGIGLVAALGEENMLAARWNVAAYDEPPRCSSCCCLWLQA